jgi:Tfp pilus assembly protein PilE
VNVQSGERAMSRHQNGGTFTAPRHRVVAESRAHAEDGFTLIELLIVCLILPIIIGGIAFALIEILSLQHGVAARISDAADAQTVSTYYEKDVQSAAALTTLASSTPQCGTGVNVKQLLGLEWSPNSAGTDQTVVSYDIVPSGSTYSLVRQYCTSGSLTPTSTTVISSDIPCLRSPSCPSGQPPPTITDAIPNDTSDNTAAEANWISTAGSSSLPAVTGVTLAITEPGSSYSYTLVSDPNSSASSSKLGVASAPTTGCGFTTPGTSLYASTLCFVDFSNYDYAEYNNATSGSCQTMTAGIANTPYTLSFCLSTTDTGGSEYTEPNPIQDPSRGSVQLSSLESEWLADPVPTNSVNYYLPAVVPWPTPTYSDPPTSEAFLGDNGFYTGIPGDPALYQNDEGSFSYVYFTNIKLTDSNGNAATNWKLVTGDAESTDGAPGDPEYLIWTSNQDLYLLPNSATSAIGNACADPTSPDGLTGSTSSGAVTSAELLAGQGATTVECEGDESSDKTGTVMLAALAPTQLTVQMQGQGLEAIFLGVLLP